MESRSDNSSYTGENYTVDEMMDRLKRDDHERRHKSSSSDREIVTREDGTQVVKVRKRKRRSKQPSKKKNSLSPKVKWSILGAFVVLALTLGIAITFIIAKYNGKSFKEKTEAQIIKLSGAQNNQITQLRVTPLSAKVSKYTTNWDSHSFLKSAEFNKLQADIKATSFFTRNWIGEEVVASTGKVYFQKPNPTSETTSNAAESPYDFGSYRCNQLDIFFGEEKGAPAILGLQISQRQMISEKYQFVFQDGLMKIKNWPELVLSSGVITLNSQDAEIKTLLEASNGQAGELTISGNIKKDINQTISLDIKAKDYPMQELLGTELGRIIQGNVQSDLGSLTYDYQQPSAEGLSFILPFNSTEINLSDLPFLTTMKDLTGNTDYVHPVFNNCRGNIMRTSEGVNLNNLNLISSSLITINGDIQLAANKKLSGTLKISVPSSIFDSPPPKSFSGPNNGLYHAEITLSGTIHNPHDNLRELINQHSGTETSKAIIRSGKTRELTPTEKMERDFEELSR